MIAAIVDSHPVFIRGLTTVLENSYAGIEVFRSSSIALYDAQKGSLKPDFLLLGLNHHFNPGEMMVFEMVKKTLLQTPVIVLYNELHMIVPFLKCEVDGIIPKQGNPDEVIDCINNAILGHRHLCKEVLDLARINLRSQNRN